MHPNNSYETCYHSMGIQLNRINPSIEFLFLALFKLSKKPIKRDPLNLEGNLREVEPILFV